MTVSLWLVRHGETAWGAAGRLTGWTDIELSDVGRRQALALRARLAGQTFAGTWSSDLRRAAETARLAYGAARADQRLRELDFGILEGRRWAELSAADQARLIRFEGFVAPGGESVQAMRARILDFVADLGPGQHLVVTHGGVIRLLLRAFGTDRHVAPAELVIMVPSGPAAATRGRHAASAMRRSPGSAD